jgi:hypothetical protein
MTYDVPYNIEGQIDPIEDMILIALHAKTKSIRNFSSIPVGREMRSYACDFSLYTPKKSLYPSDMYTTIISENNTDHYRLFTCDMDALVCDPVKLIGARSETVLMTEEGEIRWSCLVPMPAPRGVVAITNQKVNWFAKHLRVIDRNLNEEYERFPIPVVGNRVPEVKFLGWPNDNGKVMEEHREKFAIHLSVVEDAIRKDAVLATVEEHAKLRFAVSDDAYKDFFAMRDGYRNTPSGRRNPILHWCASHLRKTQSKQSTVIGHERGNEAMTHGNLTLSLSRNKGYSEYL